MAATPCEKQIDRLVEQLEELGFPDVDCSNVVDQAVQALQTLEAYRKYIRLLYERQQMFGVLLAGLSKTIRATFLDIDLEQFRKDHDGE